MIDKQPFPTKDSLVIFDIDGTLTDSVAVHQFALTEALIQFGFTGFNTDWGSYLNHTDSYVFKTIFEAQSGRLVTSIDNKKFETMLFEGLLKETEKQSIQEIKGAAAIVRELYYNSRYAICFATGSFMRPALMKMTQAGIFYRNDLVVAADDFITRDEIVLTAIDRAKEHFSADSFKRIISVGDGLWDYKTAINNKLEFIGIGKAKFKGSGANHIVDDFTNNEFAALLI